MAAFLRLMKEEVEDATERRILYEARTFNMPVQRNMLIRYDSCVSVYFGVWSIQSLCTSLARKPFDGENLIEGLLGRRFVLVSSYVDTIETETHHKRFTR